MKGWGRDIAIAFLAGVVLPAAALRVGALLLTKSEPIAMETAVPSEQSPVQLPEQKAEPLYMLFREGDGLIVVMDMDAYLLGAVLAEMPASFEAEALKAQSVAARTYALKAKMTGGKHGDGSVCGDHTCCQAYLSPDEFIESGGRKEDLDKIREAVESTSGKVLTFDNALIEATYFSCSGGRTEEAAAVWGVDYPYLMSVESPGEEGAVHYMDTVSFSADQFQSLLGMDKWDISTELIGEITYTAGGGVDTIEIGDCYFKGTDLRTRLGLRSTVFWIEVAGNTVLVHTRGYGHRVGMSQYGADAMALQGSNYEEILAHYYPGTDLIVWKG